MADVAFVALLLAFFAVAVLLVRGCERILGADHADDAGTAVPVAPDHEELAA